MTQETVVLVHGTFAEPRAGTVQWYEPNSDFCKELDRQLRELGSDARCWAHCTISTEYFSWDGRNQWVSRADAAVRLKAYLKDLKDRGWTCHVVAHSHGGNILLDAVTDERGDLAWRTGNLVTLGTPYLTPVEMQGLQLPRVLAVLVAILFWTILAAWVVGTAPALREAADLSSLRSVLFLGGLAVAWRLIWPPVRGIANNFLGHLFSDNWLGLGSHWAAFDKQYGHVGLQYLRVITSHEDEAVQFLRQISRTPDTWSFALVTGRRRLAKLGPRTFGWVWNRDQRSFPMGDARVAAISTSAACVVLGVAVTLGISGGDPRLGAILAWAAPLAAGLVLGGLVFSPSGAVYGLAVPMRIIIGAVWLLPVFVGYLCWPLVARLVLQRGWHILMAASVGYADYPVPLEGVRVTSHPVQLGEVWFETLNLHPAAERMAVGARNGSGDPVMKNFMSLIGSQELSVGKATELLQRIQRDVRLVHGAYMALPEAIGQIADWLANGDEYRTVFGDSWDELLDDLSAWDDGSPYRTRVNLDVLHRARTRAAEKALAAASVSRIPGL